MNIKNNPDFYLSPSRANIFANKSLKEFIGTYVFGDKRPETRPMKRGKFLHELVYAVIDPSRMEALIDSNLKDLEKKEMQSIQKELEYILPNILDPKEVEKIAFEKELSSEKLRFKGICDIITPNLIIDVKTTGGDTSGEGYFRYSGDPYYLGFQEIMYKDIMNVEYNRKTSFKTILIGTGFPYEVMLCDTDGSWIGDLKDYLYGKVVPKYEAFLEELDNSLSEFEKDWFKSTDRSKDVYNKLIGKEFMSVHQTLIPTTWKIQELQLRLGYK